MSDPSALTDRQSSIIQPLIPAAEPGGRHHEVDMRELINSILYLNRTDCSWRMLPHDFPPWGTVHYLLPSLPLGRHVGEDPRSAA